MTETSGNTAASESSNLAGTLRESAGAAFLCLDANHQVVFISELAKRLLHLPAAPAPPQLRSLPEPLPAVVAGLLAAGGGPREAVFELPAPGGPITLDLQLVPWGEGTAGGGAVVLLQDRHAWHRFERNVQRLNRLASLGTLSAGMAHEIKNALVPVRTFIELLLEKQPDAELGHIVRREIGRIDSIVSRMLGFAGPNRPILSKVSLQQILQHSLRLVQSPLDEKGIVCQPDFRAARDQVEADAAQLQQALVNLLLNAHEAMPPGGTLRVTTETIPVPGESAGAEAGSICVTIRDSGPGIAPEDLPRLFEPFFTTKPHGTGLGLAITQRILHEHRGTITVESVLGQGAAFRITLPLVKSAA